jgi:hypothetical protein
VPFAIFYSKQAELARNTPSYFLKQTSGYQARSSIDALLETIQISTVRDMNRIFAVERD